MEVYQTLLERALILKAITPLHENSGLAKRDYVEHYYYYQHE